MSCVRVESVELRPRAVGGQIKESEGTQGNQQPSPEVAILTGFGARLVLILAIGDNAIIDSNKKCQIRIQRVNLVLSSTTQGNSKGNDFSGGLGPSAEPEPSSVKNKILKRIPHCSLG